jgi:hypothetical protein
MQKEINYIVAAGAAAAFMTAAYYLPGETLLAAFSAGLFLIPTAFFMSLIHKTAKA